MIKIKKLKKLNKKHKIAASSLATGFVVLSIIGIVISNKSPDQAYAQPGSTNKGATSVSKAGKSKETEAQKAAASAAAASAAAAKAAASKAAQAAAKKPAAVSPAPAISSSLSLYADPNSNVARQAREWAATYPSDAAKMNRLASTPMAAWFGEWSGNIQASTSNYVSSAGGKVPVLVAYNIPNRDCGSYSAGGAASSESYKNWINGFAKGIGGRKAIVILEPDALAGIDCLDGAGQQNRLQLINFAVQALRTQSSAAIYIDAGNSNWVAASTMASRLNESGIAQATGFSLNVSNFYTTQSNIVYGQQLSRLIGNKHFVIDTSRNGNGAASGNMSWCNPDGRAFGSQPTLQTGKGLVDAYLWIKSPGESDGTCGPAQAGASPPSAGAWWPQYALMLANNSGW